MRRQKLFIVCFLLMLVSSFFFPLIQFAVVSAEPYSVVSMDSYVDGYYPDSNYGASHELYVTYGIPGYGVLDTYVYIDLVGLFDYLELHPAYSIKNVTINTTLQVPTTAAQQPIKLHKITSNWTEYGVTYNNRPTYNSTIEQEIDVPSGQIIAYPLSIDVTDLVLEYESNPSSFLGFALSPYPDTDCYIFSREANPPLTWNVTFTYGPAPSATPGGTIKHYFRSDMYETLGVSAYGLDTDYTNTHQTINITFPIYYGFRAWLVSSATISTELTNSTPTAYIYLNGSETYDSYSSTWLCPETTVNLGYQALKITVYASTDFEEWTALASYITPVLITKQIEESTWTFTLQVAFDGANAVYSWGDTNHRSGISGITFTEPLESEIQLWRINTGDYLGFILGAYIDVIGEAFYVLCLIGVAGTFYFRYRNFGVIAFFFAIFGGVGGLVWFLVPPWAAAVASALIIVGTSFIVWRVIR